jgi:hypothetical protein
MGKAGKSWENIHQLVGAFWSVLFQHRGALYLLGCDRCYGSLVIRRSEDEGFTWSFPVDAENGYDTSFHFFCRLHPLASNQVKQKLAGTRPSAK